MNVVVYYRSKLNKRLILHKYRVDSAGSVYEAISAVEESLTAGKESYVKPILALVQGGKE